LCVHAVCASCGPVVVCVQHACGSICPACLPCAYMHACPIALWQLVWTDTEVSHKQTRADTRPRLPRLMQNPIGILDDTFLVDFDGDGLDDAVVWDNTGGTRAMGIVPSSASGGSVLRVALSDGTRFTPAVAVDVACDALADEMAPALLLGSVTGGGGGGADAVCVTTRGYAVAQSSRVRRHGKAGGGLLT
jgi:hypothetical protein